MHDTYPELVTHDHTFGQDEPRPGERRTRLVVLLTVTMMVAEIIAGVMFGSMALLADGLHMASHSVALGLALIAYVYARRHAADRRFSFGTGKVNALAGFSGALLLAVFATGMALESVSRFVEPVSIEFNQAILVACLGLVVNVVSALLLQSQPHSHGADAHAHSHTHGHDHAHEQDLNLRSADLHVLADALTSVAAIAALLSGKYLGWNWMDPTMGLVGSALVATWSWSLMRSSARVLLDHQAPTDMVSTIRAAIESEGGQVTDLHVWSIGPGIWAAEIGVIADEPRDPHDYKSAIPANLGVVHTTVEVHRLTTPDRS